MFRKILIANRGEIAVRVIRACREMEIPSAAVFSEVDRGSLHVRMADEAVAIGPAEARKSYLSIERVIEAARRVGADAVHPGYGFLSENAEFAAACAEAGVKFIGPTPEAMRLMGSKTRARRAMTEAGVPVVPGASEAVGDIGDAVKTAGEIGFPVMLKAVAGGGGKGMRLVSSAEDLASALEQARGEALSAFGDADVYIEKALVRPRHIEVQILADEHGGVIHLGERECSLQRRHQKVLEESPSPFVERHPEVRERLTGAAVRAARAAAYTNAGTVEFLMDADGEFYFLEMNTRLQVEHPVTEWVTGIDIVHEQIRVAAGQKLRYRQSGIRHRGAAIECRVYAEDPKNHFFPSPGLITSLSRPAGPGVRVDSAAYAGWRVPVDYDPLIAKLAVWAETRTEAIARLRGALREYRIGGIKTTLDFFRDIVTEADFCAGDVDTGYISRYLEGKSAGSAPSEDEERAAMLAAAVHFLETSRRRTPQPMPAQSGWKRVGRSEMLR